MWWKLALKNKQVKKRGAGSGGPGGLKSLALQPGDVGASALRFAHEELLLEKSPGAQGYHHEALAHFEERESRSWICLETLQIYLEVMVKKGREEEPLNYHK